MSGQRGKDGGKWRGKSAPGGAPKRENKPIDDERFAGKSRDARFAPMKRTNMKVQVDERFKDMFTDKRFTMPNTVDKYGRPAKHSNADDMRRFYRLQKEEEEAAAAAPKEEEEAQAEEASAEPIADEASQQEAVEEEVAEEAVVAADDADAADAEAGADGDEAAGAESSDESSSEESESEESAEEEEEEVIEDDEEVPTGGETRRLAALKMDWEHLRAVDLLVLFNSFLPAGGAIASVTVYPSQFGLQAMAKEATEGPPREIWKSEKERTSERRRPGDMDETETFAKTKLRRYELNKLKYYFAVIECDSVETASSLYAACDGIEVERSSNVLDLRFIPDEETFEQKPRDVATEVPSEYKPPNFHTKALQHTKVDLTWDGDDATRQVLKASQWGRGAEADENELQAYLASSSDEYEEADAEARKSKAEQAIAKYKALVEEVTPKAAEEENMEITFMPGLSEKAEEMVQKHLESREHKDETVWERHLREKKARKAEKRRMAALQLGGGEGGSGDEEGGEAGDAFFDTSSANAKSEAKRKGKRRERKERLTPEEEAEKQRQMAELELLVMDGKKAKPGKEAKEKDEHDDDSRKKRKKHKETNSSFKVDLKDERFKALIESDAFAIDKTNPLYRETANMQTIMAAKRKKALEREMQEEQRAKARLLSAARGGVEEGGEGEKRKSGAGRSGSGGSDPALAALVASVKRKGAPEGAGKKAK